MKLQLFLFLLLCPCVAAMEVNEIMYNPLGDDAGNEWVEIYNPENSNLSNWTIGDLNSNDSLVPVKITNSSFIIIVENASAFNDSNVSVYYAGSTIGNGLGNAGDTIYLYDSNKNLVDSVSYNSTFANGNNKTLEKFNSSWNESFFDGGTPGFQNYFPEIIFNLTNQTNSTNLTGANETNTTSNNTNNQTNSSINETSAPLCIAKIAINTTKEVYSDEPIKFRNIVNSSTENFSIIYWVEDFFGNIVKEKYETKTLTEKSYTPHPDEKDKVYVVKSILNGCNESYAEKIVIYKTNETIEEDKKVETPAAEKGADATDNQTEKPKFSYNLTSYPEEIEQNSDVNAIVQVTSDDSPHTIYLQAYIYKYSKKYSDIAEYEFTIEKLDTQLVELSFFTNATPGDYKLKVKINKDEQKTDYEITKNITVVKKEEADLLETQEIMENTTKNATKELPKNSSKSLNVTNDPIVYQSSKAKSEYTVPILIITILAGVSGILIWKR